MKTFVIDMIERAIRTFAQSLIAILAVGATDIIHVNWISALSTALLATVISLLTSLSSLGLTANNQNASIIDATTPNSEVKNDNS